MRVLLENETHDRTDDYFHAKLDEPGRPGSLIDAMVTGTARLGPAARAAV